eukprot:ANDGO_01140.mRNA.1 GPI mannosyltransferase 3
MLSSMLMVRVYGWMDASTRAGFFLFWTVRALQGLLLVRTFFSPDEFYQCTEVAYHAAFGTVGYIPWEWRSWAQIRGFTHPLIFTVLYKALAVLNMDTRFLVREAPIVLMSLLVAVQDASLCRIAKQAGLNAQLAGLFSLCSWAIGYIGSRTLANSMEAIFTTLALECWFAVVFRESSANNSSSAAAAATASASRKGLCRALVFTGVCIVLRPTSGVFWAALVLTVVHKLLRTFSLLYVCKLCVGTAVVTVGLSVLLDSFYYGQVTVVPWNFVVFNVAKNFSAFYGTHPFHWYFSNALPTLLGPYVILWSFGLYQLARRSPQGYVPASQIRVRILDSTVAWAPAVFTILVYSLLGHKEFRFIYQLLPVYGILPCVHAASSLFSPSGKPVPYNWKSLLLMATMLSSFFMLLFLGLVHQGGVLRATRHLSDLIESKSDLAAVKRFQQQRLQIRAGPEGALEASGQHFLSVEGGLFSVDFLTPCHHAPLYSYFHDLPVALSFLTCDPSPDVGFRAFDRRFLSDIKSQFAARWQGRRRPDFLVMFDSAFAPNSRWWSEQGYSLIYSTRHGFAVSEEFESPFVHILELSKS